MAAPLDPLAIVAGTGDAAFAVDEQGRIVIWNKGAERLLGHEAARVLGRPCHEVLCGEDVFGNRYCHEDCALIQMSRRREPILRFEMDVREASGDKVRAGFSVVVVPGPRASQFTIVHIFQPVSRGKEADDLIRKILSGPAITGPPPIQEGAYASASRQVPLTAREMEVLRLMAGGTGTREIADSLFISRATVRNHIQHILSKLEAHSKLEAVSLALRNRLI